MITLLAGENSFELARGLEKTVVDFDGLVERFDSTEVDVSKLSSLLTGTTLFADKRLVVIKNLSENKELVDALPNWLPRLSDDVHLLLTDPKPDKRTKAYKDLKKDAIIREFHKWGDRDIDVAEKWVASEAYAQALKLDKKSIKLLVTRVGLDQWQLYYALKKLSVLEVITPEIIEQIVEASPNESVFNLLDAALRGDAGRVQVIVRSLQRTQDPYMTFGLLSGQVFQLAVLAISDKSSGEVASTIGAHPYALGKLAPHAKKLGRAKVRRIGAEFADTDYVLKSSSIDPWLLIEKTLIKTASI